MSLILDALRKMELERKAKRQGSQAIRSEVLNYHGTSSAPGKSGASLITAALLLVSVSVAGFLYFAKVESPGRESVKGADPVRPIQLPTPPLSQPLEPPVQKSIQHEVNSSRKGRKQPLTVPVVTQKTVAEGITVSGIAWQDEKSLRRAVINGLLVSEGAEILGAKVVEIKESRVRFSRGGESFEIVHSAGAGR